MIWVELNVSVPSSFISNAHNELYAFYTGKGDLLKKIMRQRGGGCLDSATDCLGVSLFSFLVYFFAHCFSGQYHDLVESWSHHHYSSNSICLVTRHVSTRQVRRVERVETSVSSRAVRQARHRQSAWVRHVERVVSCRDVTSQVEFGLIYTIYDGIGPTHHCRWIGLYDAVGRPLSRCTRIHSGD